MTGVGPRVCWELVGTAVAELPGKPHSRQADPQFPSLFVQLSRGTWSYTEALNISCHWKPRKLGVGLWVMTLVHFRAQKQCVQATR